MQCVVLCMHALNIRQVRLSRVRCVFDTFLRVQLKRHGQSVPNTFPKHVQ